MVTNGDDIAVTGIGCRFPDAENAGQYFANLVRNRDSVVETPGERWSYADLAQVDPRADNPRKCWGGFLSGVDEFDSRFFRVVPSEAETLDPQQKLFLTCSWEALEDAGYARRKAPLIREVGVFAGVTWNEFSLYANEYGYLQGEYRGPGSLYWGIPNRVSYFFDFTGPSVAIDTACSSSLVAIHMASQALRAGDCEMALAGGVNLNLHPAKYAFLGNSHFLSSDGKCRGFGEGGDGYVPSEGVGVVVLRRLQSAVAAGDRIYGLIKGSATNHGGRVTGYTVPNPRAHQQVVLSALDRARVDPSDVSYIECHGTGTDLGDPIEIAGLRMAFDDHSPGRKYCGLGTVKSNIGHTEAAAGIAGLAKVLLSMQAGVLPATLHADTPSRKIDFDSGPFFLVQRNRPWERESGPLVAGISSFGAGGSNCHCIVESFEEAGPDAKRSRTASSPTRELWLPVSSLGHARTVAYLGKLRDYLAAEQPSLDDVACTLSRRELFSHRVLFVVRHIDELLDLLAQYAADSSGENQLVTGRSVDLSAEQLAVANAWLDAGGRTQASLEAPTHGRLTSVPTYAFERGRSWIHDARRLYSKRRSIQALHPLLDRNVSTARRGRFRKDLHGTEYYVDEHWVTDQPVLPGVCIVEMAAFAAAVHAEAGRVALEDIWFLEPVSPTDFEPTALQLDIATAQEETSFELTSQSGDVRHARGRVVVAPRQETRTVDLTAVRARCDRDVSRERFYQSFGRSGIVQKHRFKVVEHFWYNDSQAIAELRLQGPSDRESHYVADPTLMDGAVQTAMAHLFQMLPDVGTVLPFQIGAWSCFESLPSTVTIVATSTDLESRKYEISICSSDGRVLAHIRDFVLREYRSTHPRPLAFQVSHRDQPLPALERSEVPRDVSVVQLFPTSTDNLPGLHDSWRQVSVRDGTESALEALRQGKVGEASDSSTRIAVLIAEPGSQTGEGLDGVNGSDVLRLGRSLFELIQGLARLPGKVDLIACVRGGSAVGHVFAKACLGMFRCLDQELPRSRFRVIHLCSEADDVVTSLATEFAHGHSDLYVKLQEGRRLVETVGPLDGSSGEKVGGHRPVLAPDVWIVTGAGGKLGLLATRRLLERGQQVVMLSRSELCDEQRSRLSTVAASTPGTWTFARCDLTIDSEIAAVISNVIDKLPRAQRLGVLHCAGTIEDGGFLGKKWAAFERVVGSKVISLLQLCERLGWQRVTNLVLYSSLSSLYGNQGQTDYAFANGVLDGMAAFIPGDSAGRTNIASVHWPLWSDGGMSVPADQMSQYMARSLTRPMPTEVGLDLLDRVLDLQAVRAGIVYSDATLDAIEGKLGHGASARPPDHRDSHDENATRLPDEHVPHEDKKRSESAPDVAEGSDSQSPIRAYLLQFLEDELKFEFTEEDLDVEVSHLGVDSILQMHIVTELEKTKRFADLPQSLLVENKTIRTLVEYFAQRYPDADYSGPRDGG